MLPVSFNYECSELPIGFSSNFVLENLKDFDVLMFDLIPIQNSSEILFQRELVEEALRVELNRTIQRPT